ncbi:PTB domain-containing adapter protein ced-6-like [Anoplophora glabripennis]|uniref:PTB domain-containing adapter protein ced-6-like n=1 Tax=Anoplophora glabripennis TaxID=217634 RepID=UPI000C75691C|nr:PTB domain-containing adapter protein ced-6-like [Anoplophora glabripennis]
MGRHKKKSKRQRSPSSSSSTSSDDDYRGQRNYKQQKKKSKSRSNVSHTPPIIQPHSAQSSQFIAVSNIIPDFDPKFRDINDWIEIIQFNAISYHWSDTTIIFQALSKLKGTAKTWYDGFIESELGWSRFTWAEWKDVLISTFQSNRDFDNEAEDTHECFVFISDKLAEEITLTIGQAFELAYKRFLETSGKDLESQRRAMITQQKIKRLEQENNVYKQRLLEISQFSSIRPELDQYLRKNDIRNILEVKSSLNNNSNSSSDNTTVNNSNQTNGTTKELLDLNSEITNGAPPVPPRSFENTPAVGTKLEGLLLNELEHDNDFDPRSFENNHNTQFYPNTNGNTSSPPLIAPPPKAPRRSNLSLNTNNGNNNGDFKTSGQDLFGTTPFTPALTPSPNSVTSGKILDPFEMGDFGNAATPQDLENAIGLLDKRILEMKVIMR